MKDIKLSQPVDGDGSLYCAFDFRLLNEEYLQDLREYLTGRVYQSFEFQAFHIGCLRSNEFLA